MRKVFSFIFLILFTCCTLQDSKEERTPLLVDKKLQEKLRIYLNLPIYTQEYHFTLSILDEITHGNYNVIKYLDTEIINIQQTIELDSIFRTFTEEPTFDSKKMVAGQESYRLTIFTHLENTIEIVRIDYLNQICHIIHKKYRINNNCQPPLVTGEPWRKSCFIQMETNTRTLGHKEWEELQKWVDETEFWSIPLSHFTKSCFDGSNWSVEGWDNGNYKKIHSRCPGDFNPMKVLGEKMLRLIENYRQ